MSLTNGWTAGRYRLFRFVFGAYLCVHFVHLAPWAAETFSSAGVLPDGSASPLLHAFPNVLALADGPAFVTGLIWAAAGLAVLFGIGVWDRTAALGLWYVLACLFGRNPLTSNPSLPYVGLLLLVHACLPRVPRRGDDGWRLSPELFAAVWIVMSLGYTYSGVMKLMSPSWVDGTALAHVLDNPLARPTAIREGLLAAPPILLKIATWGGLLLELTFTPLALWWRARPWIWLLMLALHVQLLVLIDFADLSLGMVILHLFTFDPDWFGCRDIQPEHARA